MAKNGSRSLPDRAEMQDTQTFVFLMFFVGLGTSRFFVLRSRKVAQDGPKMAPRKPLGASWEPLGTLLGPLGGLLEASGASSGPLGGLPGPLGGLLGASWGLLGLLGPRARKVNSDPPSWGPLGPSWGSLGTLWVVLGRSLGPPRNVVWALRSPEKRVH